MISTAPVTRRPASRQQVAAHHVDDPRVAGERIMSRPAASPVTDDAGPRDLFRMDSPAAGRVVRPDLRTLRIDLQQEAGTLRSELLEVEWRLQAELQMEAQAVRHDLGTASRRLDRAVDRMVWKLTGLMTAEAIVIYALARLLF